MSTSYNSASIESKEDVRCNCGELAPIKMSWTYVNIGKRYRACPRYGGNEGCRFFVWIDSDVNERVSKLIRGMLKRLDKNDSEIQKLEIETRIRNLEIKNGKCGAGSDGKEENMQ